MESIEQKQQRLLPLIKEKLILEEGLKLQAYKCTEGKWTIGVGRNFQDNPFTKDEQVVIKTTNEQPIKDYPKFLPNGFPDIRTNFEKRGKGVIEVMPFHISNLAANYLLGNDLTKVQTSLRRIISDITEHHDNVIIVLTDMIFQMGFAGVMNFKDMLGAINRKEYSQAAYDLKNSKYAKQTPKRADRNAKLLTKASPNYKSLKK